MFLSWSSYLTQPLVELTIQMSIEYRSSMKKGTDLNPTRVVKTNLVRGINCRVISLSQLQ